MWRFLQSILFTLTFFFILFEIVYAQPVQLCITSTEAPIRYAGERLRRALEAQQYEVVDCGETQEPDSGARITLKLDPNIPGIRREGFQIRRESGGEPVLTATGTDPSGVLYGGLFLVEELQNNKRLEDIEPLSENPYLSFRAIKFNLPWDSYRRSEALQLHEETVRNLHFWESFLDMMAENRFNVLSLWNLHPFNYMIRSKNFPEASGFSDAEMAEWQHFYRELFRMAKERGIEPYIVNWNIFVSPEFARAHQVAPYAIEHKFFSDGDTSAVIKQYTREAVTQVINEYPDLAGIGVSLGEGMGGMTPLERQNWILETIITGMQHANRRVKLIHRAPFSANLGSGGSTSLETEQITRKALEELEGIDAPIWVEAKFNWSHGHSTPKLVKVHGGPIKDTYWNPIPKNYKMTWMIRNEDFFALRWGVPDFIREHIHQNSQPYVGGYFVGSECYIPAVDYFTRDAETIDWEYAFERQWLFYKLWGRLLYNPSTPDDVFRTSFIRRYGPEAGILLDAFNHASRMPLRLASFYDATWDFTLYSEGFLSIESDAPYGFIHIDRLIEHPPLDPNYLSIKDYVQARSTGLPISESRSTPLELATELEQDALRSLEMITGFESADTSGIQFELADIRVWANLSLYFAEKLRGGVALELYRTKGDVLSKNQAISHLEKALESWDEVIRITEPLYREMPLVHLNDQEDTYFHWSKLREVVAGDIERARLATMK